MFAKLLLLFITVPLVEFLLLMKIGFRIGFWPTFAIILITGFIGAWLTRIQGLRTLSRFQKAATEGRLPHQEVMDGVMILVAGAVLLTPGFLTDVAGFLLLVPPVRTMVRKYLSRYLKRRIRFVSPSMGAGSGFGPGMDQEGGSVDGSDVLVQSPAGTREVKARVIETEVVDD